jgi:putative FmdB family regulatory protein
MPIYEYHCTACEHDFEVMQKITEPPIRKCEKCGRLKAKKMISQTSFVLKGSGWYVTDYGGKKPSNSENSHPPTESKEASSSSTDNSSDTKKSSGADKKTDTVKKAANA